MTNRPGGTLYVSVTSDLIRRSFEHREQTVEGFTDRYGLKRLVYFEAHETAYEAIRREKRLKLWKRAWKTELIEQQNPGWEDLYPMIVG